MKGFDRNMARMAAGKSHDTKVAVDPHKDLKKDNGYIDLPRPKTQKEKDELALILGTFADVMLACRRDPSCLNRADAQAKGPDKNVQ